MRCFYQVEIAHIGVLHYYAKLQLNFASKRSGGWVLSSMLDRVKGGNERNHASDGGKDGRTNYGGEADVYVCRVEGMAPKATRQEAVVHVAATTVALHTNRKRVARGEGREK